MDQSAFPPWVDRARPLAGALLVLVPVYVVSLLYYGGSPRTTDVGYAPVQPVPYSHALHAGELGLDCRYCHVNVETSARALVPPTQTCMNCHARIAPKSAKLLIVEESAATGKAIPWVRVHDLPDYVYFNHSAHVARGVGCVSCHGRVDRMERVAQVERLSMGWCLECHRNPEPHLRPKDVITKMDWTPGDDGLPARGRVSPKRDFSVSERPSHVSTGERMVTRNVTPSTDCSTCHR